MKIEELSFFVYYRSCRRTYKKSAQKEMNKQIFYSNAFIYEKYLLKLFLEFLSIIKTLKIMFA